MKRTLALLAVWIVFAVTAVGVGFAASGFIDQPFAAAAGVAVPEEASPAGGAATNPTTAATPPTTLRTPTQTPPQTPPRTPTPTTPTPTTTPRTTTRPSSGGRPTATAPGSPTTTRSVNTEAGYVGARCTRGLVTVSASPAPGWQLNGISAPGQDEGEVEFEQSGDGEASIEITALCGVSGPTLTVQRFAGDGDSDTGTGTGGDADRDADSDSDSDGDSGAVSGDAS